MKVKREFYRHHSSDINCCHASKKRDCSPESLSSHFCELILKMEERFDGIKIDSFGRFFSAASACWTASCLTSKI